MKFALVKKKILSLDRLEFSEKAWFICSSCQLMNELSLYVSGHQPAQLFRRLLPRRPSDLARATTHREALTPMLPTTQTTRPIFLQYLEEIHFMKIAKRHAQRA